MTAARLILVGLFAALLAPHAYARSPLDSPQASGRAYGLNYKDLVLAWCVAEAYPDSDAAADAGSSVSALIDWTYYDMETAIKPMHALIKRYLARDYSNPIVENEVPGIKFNFLKCLDLYHSKELQDQVRRYVEHPNRTYRQDRARKY